MPLIRHGSRSHYSQYIATKIKLAEAEAQLTTLRALGVAIKQERRILEQALNRVPGSAFMATYADRSQSPSDIRIA
jgi:hypothetical protein